MEMTVLSQPGEGSSTPSSCSQLLNLDSYSREIPLFLFLKDLVDYSFSFIILFLFYLHLLLVTCQKS